MHNFSRTDELMCSECSKPFTFARLSETRFEQNGCNCIPPRMANETPVGAFISNLGGLWVLRIPKKAA